MKFLVIISILAFLLSTPLYSQSDSDTTNYWNTNGNFSILFNQISFNNWAKGGESSMSGTTLFKYKAKYDDSTHAWETNIDLAYGLINSDEFGTRKNEDNINIQSKYGHRATDNLAYTGLLGFQSQFYEGFNFPDDSTVISNFLAPAYVLASVGMDWKPNEDWSIYLSPTTGRLTIVNDENLAAQGAFGVDPGKKTRMEFGAYATIRFRKEVFTNITVDSRLDLFNNFTDVRKDNRDRIDVNSETTIVMKVNSYISANIFIHMIYDHDVDVPLFERVDGRRQQVGTGKRLQIKETLGIGFSYKF